MTDIASLVVVFLTVSSTIFIAELTDKDALLLLALATKTNPWTVFAAGSTAFTITTAIIVPLGYALVQIVPVFWIKIAGGAIMIVYGFWQYLRRGNGGKELEKEEKRLLSRGLGASPKNDPSIKEPKKVRGKWSVFLGAVLILALLDLAGDATEVLTIVFVAQIRNAILVFFACVSALVAATAVETAIGHRLGKMLSVERIKLLSLVVFVIIGSFVILSSFYPFLIPGPSLRLRQ